MIKVGCDCTNLYITDQFSSTFVDVVSMYYLEFTFLSLFSNVKDYKK